MRRVQASLLFSALFSLSVLAGAACSSSDTASPGSASSSSGGKEGGVANREDDADTPASDAGTDAAPATDGGMGDILGTLTSGVCGTIKSELTSPSPSLDINTLVFTAGEVYEKASLSPGGQELFDTANAGGSSTESEAMSFEVLHYCEGASLLHTETEIAYAAPDDSGANTITDLEVLIDGKKVGVSVTRVYRPASQAFPDADVKALLVKKLEGMVRSSQRVLPQDKWVKQILHVFSVNQGTTDAINRVLPTIDAAVRADTIVLVTQTQGGGFVYCHPTPPLGMECPP